MKKEELYREAIAGERKNNKKSYCEFRNYTTRPSLNGTTRNRTKPPDVGRNRLDYKGNV